MNVTHCLLTFPLHLTSSVSLFSCMVTLTPLTPHAHSTLVLEGCEVKEEHETRQITNLIPPDEMLINTFKTLVWNLKLKCPR